MKSLQNIRTVKLSSIASEITDGTRVKRKYIDRGIKIINISDFKEGAIYSKTIKSISVEGLKDKDFIKENDVLITSVGKSGQVVKVAANLEDCVISSDIIRIRLKQPSTAEGLVAYLKSEAGQYSLESIKSGLFNRIGTKEIKELQIPANYMELAINKSIASNEKNSASKFYKECMDLFNSYIMQEDDLFQAPKSVYINGDKIDAFRLDPKHYTYFQTKLYKTIYNYPDDIRWEPLGQVVNIKKATRPAFDENQEIEYINISNVDDDFSIINSNEKDLFKNLSSRIRYLLKEGELITAKSGSATGTKKHVTAVVTDRHAGMMASDAFYNIQPKDIDPYFLLFLFKQSIVLKQIEAGAVGLYFRTINRREFENIRLPRLDRLDESEIAENMRNYVKVLV